MLVNDFEELTSEMEMPYSKPADVKLLRYEGYDKYCNLCSGILQLEINGKEWIFGRTDEKEGVYPPFFCPTVCFAEDYNGEKQTAWETDIAILPEELRCFAKAIDEVINANMPKDICRGCD